MNQKLMLSIGIVFIIFFAIYFRVDVEKVTPKDFTPGTYYQGYNSEEAPDYKRIYGEYNQTEGLKYESCSVDSVPLKAQTFPYKPKSELGLFWFWAMPTANREILDDGEDVGDGMTLFKVPPDTQLISIGDSELIVNSQYPLSMYPETGYTVGNHIKYVVKLPEQKIAYRITYGSLLKWWACADKTEPDVLQNGDEKKPVYYIGKTMTSQNFYAGTVVGFAGKTGVNRVLQENTDTAYLLVKVESATITEDGAIETEWTNASIKELYKE